MSHIHSFNAALQHAYRSAAALKVLNQRQARGESLEPHQIAAIERNRQTPHHVKAPNSPSVKVDNAVNSVPQATPSQILDSVLSQRAFMRKE